LRIEEAKRKLKVRSVKRLVPKGEERSQEE
jgi:hypothetical protein